MGEQTGAQGHSALRIVAACQSTAEFVAAYSRYCEGRSLFIATKSPKPIGHIVKFKIALASGEHLMTGVGPVVETFDDRDNRFSRPGMRIEVEKLDASGREWMEQLRNKSAGAAAAAPGSAPRVASSPTGMFSTISEESSAIAAPPARPTAPAAQPPPVPAAAAEREKKEEAAPVPIADNLSAGWELDGLSDALAPLRKPRPPGKPAGKPGDRRDEKAAAPAPEKPAEEVAAKPADAVAARPADAVPDKPTEAPAEAVVASGELEVPPPLPPPPRNGRSKRITFPALMFNKSRGIATPPTGAVVPKPVGKAAAPGGKARPPTAPLMTTSQMAALAPAAAAEREPAAPVAPLGTPADTEPHEMVPPEIESSLARAHAPLAESPAAEGTPPPAADPASSSASSASSASSIDETHPDISDAPPEDSGEIHTGETQPEATPDRLRRRAKDSNTTPPPVWASRTVTQTLHALVGGKPDPKVQEETVHWTNPGFAALGRPPPPHVDIIEEEMPAARNAAVPVEVGVEITADVMDKTVISPPPIAASRRPLVGAVAITAALGLGIGYFLGLSRGTPLEKLPVGEVAVAGGAPASGERPSWAAQCPAPAGGETAAAEVPAGETGDTAPAPTAAARTRLPEARAAQPPAAAASSPSSTTSSSGGCYLNALTSPVGATVLIDNKVSGRTPLRTRVSCGQHSVKFEMVNFQAATRTFTARRGETEKLSVELNRQRTVLRIESTPSGATVLVDSRMVGVTPLTTTIPGAATSTVTVSRPGFSTVRREINPTSGSARMSVKLKQDARRSASSRR